MTAKKSQRRDPIFGAPLTPGEQPVYDLMCEGKSNPEIALTLGLSQKTVKVHIGRIFKKKGERNRAKLALTPEAVTRRATIATERARNLPRSSNNDE